MEGTKHVQHTILASTFPAVTCRCMFSVLLLSNPKFTVQLSFGPGSMRTLWLWESNLEVIWHSPHVPWSKVAILGMVIPPLIGILIYNGCINPYYWVDEHPLLYGNNESLDPGTHGFKANFNIIKMIHLGRKCCMVGSPPTSDSHHQYWYIFRSGFL